jgi:hypothetical protein
VHFPDAERNLEKAPQLEKLERSQHQYLNEDGLHKFEMKASYQILIIVAEISCA